MPDAHTCVLRGLQNPSLGVSASFVSVLSLSDRKKSVFFFLRKTEVLSTAFFKKRIPLKNGKSFTHADAYNKRFMFHHIPMARERFRPPFTRPSAVTFPPAFSMRVRSRSSSGLWSNERSTALPFRQRTQRESPALATTRWFLHKRTTHAVQPLSEPGCGYKTTVRMQSSYWKHQPPCLQTATCTVDSMGGYLMHNWVNPFTILLALLVATNTETGLVKSQDKKGCW